MSGQFQAVRGMNDVLPSQVVAWQRVEAAMRDLLDAYGYREIRMPLLESTGLFHRSIGEVTDIVEKEMYTFADRNGDSLTLRPEGTASCVRACIEHGLLHNQQQRLWYAGPMFRHERPQAGRFRQFHQIGVEAFGVASADLDAELIVMSARLWQALEIEGVELQINSLGSIASRAAYRERLVAYLQSHYDILDEDSKRRLQTNPLRVLDAKTPGMQAMLSEAPSLLDCLDDDSRAHFDRLQTLLTGTKVPYVVNTRLVRGLDYYCKTVFEWVTTRLGAQGTICAGGRYDGLIEQLGGRATPAAGFALGVERVIGLLDAQQVAKAQREPSVYVIALGEQAEQQAFALADTWRQSGLRVMVNLGGGSVKSQFKRADASGARLAVVVGDEELQRGLVAVKNLREAGHEQAYVAVNEAAATLYQILHQH